MRFTQTVAMAFTVTLLLSCETTPETKPTESVPPSTSQAPALSDADKKLLTDAQAAFKALPAQAESPTTNSASADKLALGKMLFHEPRLSKSGAISCNSCHNLATYGVDNRSNSIGHGFKTGDRNSPTVMNAAFHTAQFWDGRAADLEAQAEGPILNPIEMAMPGEKEVLKRLNSIPEYQDAFKKAFPGETNALTYKNVAKAIASFERTLVTPSRFDKFLGGDATALDTKEKEGLALFMSQGCTACHSGVGIGGGMYQKFGLLKPYTNTKDLGRFNVTKQASDKFMFKVPSLRNITRTYPYFHDGQVWDLAEAVKVMGKLQLGKDLSGDEVEKLVAFLNSLTGEMPKDAMTLPQLPASTKDTPLPTI